MVCLGPLFYLLGRRAARGNNASRFPTGASVLVLHGFLAQGVTLKRVNSNNCVSIAGRSERIKQGIRHGLGRLLDLLLPRHCLMCGLPSGDNNLCPPCRADLPRPNHSCKRCGLPLPGSDNEACGACLQHAPPWDRVVAALDYRFPVDVLVQRFKFKRNLACGEVLAEELGRAVVSHYGARPAPDAVVPVPLHHLRQAARTFNQSELLARRAAEAVGSRLSRHLLTRVRRTHAQSGLDAHSRRRNTRGAFHCHHRKIGKLQRLALVDDVMTTGATIEACTRELKRCGVKEVSVWVVARAPPP